MVPSSTNVDIDEFLSDAMFPVDFDAFWQWCGYSTKQKAEQMLQKNFTQEVDFNFNREVKVQKEGKQQVTRKIKSYQLTIDCAKSFAMLAQTEKGREVRLYFLECEKRLKALTKGKNKLQILKESVETLIDHEERISDLEQERADAKAYLAAINKDPSQALFVDTRHAFDHIIKSYALAKGVPAGAGEVLISEEYCLNMPRRVSRAGFDLERIRLMVTLKFRVEGIRLKLRMDMRDVHAVYKIFFEG